MREETVDQKQKQPLRSGYTTGACATATSLAAAHMLLRGKNVQRVTITLPRGKQAAFSIERCERIGPDRARASTIKDAGDDPDATHGATVFTEIELSQKQGTRFYAAEGVGTVTREGLCLSVGEPAINPVPRTMIAQHLVQLAEESDYAGGFDVYVGIVDGEKIALKTMNGRLGIVGGLSILGTTGIVRPFSCAAYIASIHNSIDVAHANGISHIAASTGSTSEHYIQQRLNLPDMALVEMGDFAGAVLKYLRKVPMKKLSICGGFGKMTKMAAGHHSLHSKDSTIDFNFLADLSEELGGDARLKLAVKNANTSLEALNYCESEGLHLADRISQLAQRTALKVSQHKIAIDTYCVDKSGCCVQLIDNGIEVIYSIVGLVRTPSLNCAIHRGGFSDGERDGIAGMAAYVSKKRIDLIIDATHPYAAEISANAVIAGKQSQTPCWRFSRPGWNLEQYENWQRYTHWDELIKKISHHKRPFFSIGRSALNHVHRRPESQHWIVRSAIKPEPIANTTIITAIGPFRYADERKLLETYRVDALITKDSGCRRVENKMEAASDLGMPIYIQSRPNLMVADRTFEKVERIVSALCGVSTG